MFKNWFGSSEDSGGRQGTEGQRVAAQEALAETVPGFLLRQPIMDVSNRVVGHDLGYRETSSAPGVDVLLHALDESTLGGFARLDLSGINGLLFLRINPALLEDERLGLLPRQHVVLVLDASAPGFAAQHGEPMRVSAGEGWRLALDNPSEMTDEDPLLPALYCLRFDLRRYNAVELDQQIKALGTRRASLMLIARQVESEDEYEACQAMAFDAFQGYFFVRVREQWPRRIDHDRIRVMRLLNLVAQHAEIPELDSVIRRDAMLAYKLLAYINSPLSGLDHQLSSISQALMFLGYEPLYRWLTVLLFTCGTRHPRDRMLLQQALLRARLLELIGLAALTRKDSEALFLVGMFSLFDALFNVSMEEALEPLNLAGAIRGALLSAAGPYAACLQLGIALEGGQWYDADALARSIGLDADRVNPLLVEAMAWSSTLDNLPLD